MAKILTFKTEKYIGSFELHAIDIGQIIGISCECIQREDDEVDVAIGDSTVESQGVVGSIENKTNDTNDQSNETKKEVSFTPENKEDDAEEENLVDISMTLRSGESVKYNVSENLIWVVIEGNKTIHEGSGTGSLFGYVVKSIS
jgi:hypothetical protein